MNDEEKKQPTLRQLLEKLQALATADPSALDRPVALEGGDRIGWWNGGATLQGNLWVDTAPRSAVLLRRDP